MVVCAIIMLKHSQFQIINILVSNLVQVMRNVSEQCDKEERSTHVQHYIHRMQFSGYPQEDRVLVYKKAKKVFENIVERDTMMGSVECTGENFGKGKKEQHWTRNMGGMKMGIMKLLCS